VFNRKNLEMDKNTLGKVATDLGNGIDGASDTESRVKAIGRVLDVKRAQEYVSQKTDRADLAKKKMQTEDLYADTEEISPEGEGSALKRFSMQLNMLISRGVKRFSKRS
jgi:hypothetical protein